MNLLMLKMTQSYSLADRCWIFGDNYLILWRRFDGEA